MRKLKKIASVLAAAALLSGAAVTASRAQAKGEAPVYSVAFKTAVKPKDLSAKEVDRLVRSVTFGWVADWLTNYVVKQHPDKESLRQGWMATDDPMAARAGWSLTAERIVKSPEGLDLVALLDRIESEMGKAAPEVQWTMNSALAEIGIHFSKHRTRAIAIGEKLGIYRDYPCSKGCTSPFAPIWINEMVRRQSST